MPTLQQMVYRCRHYLQGFSQEQQQYTYLLNAIGPTDLTITVADGTQFSRGEVEINGLELVYLNTVNQSSGVGTVLPAGRGWFGSTAQSAPQLATVEDNPIFPYVRVVEAINDTIGALYPDLYAVGTQQFAKISVLFGYQMPANAEEVISVRYNLVGPSHTTPWMRRWRFDNAADTNVFTTGKAVWFGEDVTPGQTITVLYCASPTLLVNPTDDFVGVTGLPPTADELVIYGACAKLAPALEGPRLALQAAEVSERVQGVPPGSASKVSQYFNSLYQQRLAAESRHLYDKYERPPHFTS